MSDFFSPTSLELSARQHGFTKRASKLKPWMFIDVLLFQMKQCKEVSLLSMCDSLFIRFGIKISKQSIDERFNSNSVKYIKSLLKSALQKFTATHFEIPIFENFTEVNIKDSTRFGLPSSMKDIYPGNNTKTTESVANLQLQYNLKNNCINELSIQANTVNDYKNAYNTINDIKKGSLSIRDLGYVSLDLMEQIDKKEAFFLNRLKPRTDIYEKKNGKYVKLSLKSVRLSLKKSGKPIVSKDVFIGRRKFLPCRVVISLVPEDKIKARKQKQARKTQRRGAKTSDPNVMALIGLNVFVTNATEKQLPLNQIYNIYKLRWQIELIFKTWKQISKFHQHKNAKPERVETMLFAQLLLIVVHWSVISIFTNYFFIVNGKLLSFYKASKTLKAMTYDIQKCIKNKRRLLLLFDKITEVFISGHWVERRKGIIHSQEILNTNTY